MLRIRPMTAGDVERVAELCGQLGYPSTAADLSERFRILSDQALNAIFVAVDDQAGSAGDRAVAPGREAAAHTGTVVGWLHVARALALEASPWAEVWGLVVDAAYRGRGVGSRLLAEAEQWARDHGFAYMRLRSNVVRAEAHEFYRRRGYDVIKTQVNFRKAL